MIHTKSSSSNISIENVLTDVVFRIRICLKLIYLNPT
jgi:hypothetical protein